MGGDRLQVGVCCASDSNDQDVTYDMTSNTGTMRYMSPEIALGKPYGLKADIYSFSIVMYQVLSLLQPYVNVQPSAFQTVVIMDGRRPPIDTSWPTELKDLLKRMWAAESVDRPPARDVVDTLEQLLRGEDNKLYPKPTLQRLLSG